MSQEALAYSLARDPEMMTNRSVHIPTLIKREIVKRITVLRRKALKKKSNGARQLHRTMSQNKGAKSPTARERKTVCSKGFSLYQAKKSSERLAERPFDFLVLDVHMPDLTGVEVLRRIRSEYRWSFPALFVSGEASVELKKDVEEVGGFALLPKPVEPDLFRSRIRDLVSTLIEN